LSWSRGVGKQRPFSLLPDHEKEQGLTLSGGFGHEVGNALCKFFPSTLGALRLFSIVFFYAENNRETLFTVETTILIAWHPVFLLSLSDLMD
jgi:hypothetical protein